MAIAPSAVAIALEDRLVMAATKGPEGNSARWLRFRGAEAGGRILGAAPRVLVIANRVRAAVATRNGPGQWHDVGEVASTSIEVAVLQTARTSSSDTDLAHTFSVDLARLAEFLGGAGALGYARSGNSRQVFVAIEQTEEARRGAGLSTSANAVPVGDVARGLALFNGEDHVRCPGCSNTDGGALGNNGLNCHPKTRAGPVTAKST